MDCVFARRRFKREPITVTETFIPTGFRTDIGSITNGSNALTDTTSTTYARFSGVSGSWAYFLLTFDLSSIPSNATVNSTTFKIKAKKSSSTTEYASVYGWATSPNSIYLSSKDLTTTASIYTWTDTRFTLAHLLSFNGAAGIGYSTSQLYIYGAELTVTYTYN